MHHRHNPVRLVTRLTAMSCALGWTGILCAADGEPYSWRGDLSLWSIPVFILFILAIRKLGWDSLVSGMNDREAEENRLIGEAEQARREAEELLRDHKGRLEAIDEDIRELIAEAHRDAEHTKQDIIATARRESETMRNRALHEIARARDQSLDEIFVTLNERVITATEERLSKQLTADHQSRLVEEALAKFESTS